MHPQEPVDDLSYALTQSSVRNAATGARPSGSSGQRTQQQHQHQQQQQQQQQHSQQQQHHHQQQQQRLHAQQRPAAKEPRSRPHGEFHPPQQPPTPAMSISAATSTNDNNITPPSTKQWTRPQAAAQRPKKSDSTSPAFPPWSALEAAMNTVQQVQKMERKTQALENENKRLKAQLAEMKTNAINWCMLAKSYQQDRNYIGVQLSELEVKLAQAQRRSDSSSDGSSAKGATTTTTSVQATAEKGGAGGDSTVDDIVSQSISQLLDKVTSNTGVEPRLPPLSKGHYSLEKKRTKDGADGVSTSRHTGSLRSALKTSSSAKVSACTCGCQEELRAWKMRSAFAENQIPILEMRCEKQTIILEGYKTKWTQWKEGILRAQYERRLKAAMPHHIARLEATSELQPGSLPQGSLKRTRFDTEGMLSSTQQRSATTEQNTLFNQFGAGLPIRSVSPVGVSSRPGVRFGSGSATEPHILLDDNDSDNSDKSVRGDGSHVPNAFVVDSDEDVHHFGPEYVSQPNSLTFPSDLALRRRQLLSEEDEDEDDEEEGRTEDHIGSISPSRRSLQRRNLKRPASRVHQDQPPSGSNQTAGGHRSSRGMQSLESDRSSPPMFEYSRPHIKIIERTADETEGDEAAGAMEAAGGPPEGDGQATEGHSSEPRATVPPSTLAPNLPAVGARSNESTGGSAVHKTTPEKAQPRVYVSETPLELQGITPRKDDGPHSAASGLVAPKPHHDIIPLDDFEEAPIQRPLAKLPEHDQGQERGHEQDQSRVVIDQEDWPGLEDDGDARHEGHGDGGDDDDAFMDAGQGTSRDAQQQPVGAGDERIYNFTERRKDKRKQMHGHDCACCQRFYKITGALPLPDGYNAFFTPAPRPGQKEVWEQTAEERLQDRIQQVSRHRVQHETPLTPPGFWDTDFPLTPERLEWDRIAEERKARKKQRLAHEDAVHEQARRYGQGRGRG